MTYFTGLTFLLGAGRALTAPLHKDRVPAQLLAALSALHLMLAWGQW